MQRSTQFDAGYGQETTVQIVKLSLMAAVIIGAVIGVLWATEVVARDDITQIALAAFSGLAVLVLAGFALRGLRGSAQQPDETDRPVP